MRQVRGLASFLAALVLLSSWGCQRNPYTSSYATIRPDVRDIVGSWVATVETLQGLSHGPYSTGKPRIDVHADGTIEMADIPDTWNASGGDGSGRLETFAGTWTLAKHQQTWWGLALRREQWACSGCLMVVGVRPPYKLVLRYGDPDAGNGYEFRKAT